MKIKKTNCLLFAAALAFSFNATAQNLSIATGGTGGVYYPLGGGIAAALSKYVPGMQATAEVTGGSVDNLKLIGTGKPFIGLVMTDASQDAYRGEDKFKGNKVPLRTLMILYPNRMHVVSVEGRGINVALLDHRNRLLQIRRVERLKRRGRRGRGWRGRRGRGLGSDGSREENR